MAKYTGSVCRQCRRDGMKLFLKGERCFTDKCAFERRAYAPGQHGQASGRRPTEYAIRLREKQKVKRIYGIHEVQFRRIFSLASKMEGVTGENLLRLLETRLDNSVYRSGFARSRKEARNMVREGHFAVNGKKNSIPSYILKQGDVISVREKSRKGVWLAESLGSAERRSIPEWFTVDKDKFTALLNTYPARDQITLPMNEQLIVELYSK